MQLFFLFVIKLADTLSFMHLHMMLLQIELGSRIDRLCRPILLVLLVILISITVDFLSGVAQLKTSSSGPGIYCVAERMRDVSILVRKR